MSRPKGKDSKDSKLALAGTYSAVRGSTDASTVNAASSTTTCMEALTEPRIVTAAQDVREQSGRDLRRHARQESEDQQSLNPDRRSPAQVPKTPEQNVTAASTVAPILPEPRMRQKPGVSKVRSGRHRDAPRSVELQMGPSHEEGTVKSPRPAGASTFSTPTTSHRGVASTKNLDAPSASPVPKASSHNAASPGQRKRESIKALNALLKAHSERSVFTEPTSRSTARVFNPMPVQVRVVTTAMLCLTVIAFAALFLFHRPYRKAGPYCETKCCRYHRGLIEDQLDRSVDPCTDFAGYVCGNWRKRRVSHLSTSALSDMAISWLRKFPAMLRDGTAILHAGNKALAMFNSCMTQTHSQVGIIKDFMRRRGLVWPDMPVDNVSAVDILIDLAFNWGINLWFTMDLLPSTPGHLLRRVYFSTNDRMRVWRTILQQIPPTGDKFNLMYKHLFEIFANDKSQPRMDEITESYNRMQYIFGLLSHPSKIARLPGVFPLRDFNKHSQITHPEDLKRVLNSVLGIQPPLSMDDLVLFSDMSLLKGVSEIFRALGDLAVRRHLSWLFVMVYAAVADPAVVLLILHGTEWRAQRARPYFCAAQVEACYKLLVAALVTAAYFSKEERSFIDDYLASIVKMAVNKTSSASWLDHSTTLAVSEKLRSVRTVLWPADEFLSAEGIQEAYGNFSEHAASFTHLWIDARRSLRALLGTKAGFEEQKLRRSSALPYARYEPVLNELSVSLGALAPPLFYPDGTKAMLHGGLGYFYAKELLGAMDTEGVNLDATGSVGSPWLSEDVRRKFQQRVHGCLPDNASVFPEVPAMEVAFAAFRRVAGKDDVQLSRDLTEEKVFFITACLTSCANSTANNLYGGDCNKAMMNFGPFTEVFQCPLGSRMNPEKKCAFYG